MPDCTHQLPRLAMPMRATYMPWEAVGTLSDDELRGLLMALKEKKGA